MYLRRVCPDRPRVYACSGCASAGQMANFMALKLDGLGIAQMGCLSGVAAGLPDMVAEADSGRPVLVIDGCHQGCARQCLEIRGIQCERHLVLTSLGARKRFDRDLPLEEAEGLAETVVSAACRLGTAATSAR